MGQTQDLETLGQKLRHFVDARSQVDGFQKLLLCVWRNFEIGGDQIGKRARRCDALHRADQFARRLGQKLQSLDRLLLQMQETRLDIGRAYLRLFDALHARHDEGTLPDELDDTESLFPLQDEMMRAIGSIHVAQHICDRAHAMKIYRRRLCNRRIALHQHADLALFANRLLRRRDRTLAADRNRKDRSRQQHHIADRHNNESVRRERAFSCI
jgi:hypothetical protein